MAGLTHTRTSRRASDQLGNSVAAMIIAACEAMGIACMACDAKVSRWQRAGSRRPCVGFICSEPAQRPASSMPT